MLSWLNIHEVSRLSWKKMNTVLNTFYKEQDFDRPIYIINEQWYTRSSQLYLYMADPPKGAKDDHNHAWWHDTASIWRWLHKYVGFWQDFGSSELK